MGDEMTLRQFVESTWFRGLSRGAMLLGIPALTALSGFVGYTLNGVQAEQTTLRTDIAEIRETQGDRADVADTFQAEITADVAMVDAKIEKVSDNVASVKEDVANIFGILSAMQQSRDVAARYQLHP